MGLRGRIGEIDQARGRLLGEEQLLDAFSSERPAGQTPAEVRTLLAKFGLNADHVRDRAVDSSHRGNGPGPPWRCCRPAASTCWCWTSRPTTSTCPPSSSSRTRSTAIDGALLLVTHDRRLLENVRLDVRWNVENGVVTELHADAPKGNTK